MAMYVIILQPAVLFKHTDVMMQEAERRRTGAKYGDDLREPIMYTRLIDQADTVATDVSPYTFVGCHGWSKVLSVKAHHSCRIRRTDLRSIYVLHDRECILFSSWLGELGFEPLSGKVGLDKERSWW
jgi:hypothetical protein